MTLGHVLTGPPLWVWPLLVGLLWVGWRASRQRSTHVILVYLMPLLGLISLSSVARLPEPGLVWACFLGAYLCGAVLGYRLQARWLLACQGSRVTLAGEWLTLASVLAIFVANFAAGTLRAVNPALAASLGFRVVLPAILGFVAEIFLGRAVLVTVTSRRSLHNPA